MVNKAIVNVYSEVSPTVIVPGLCSYSAPVYPGKATVLVCNQPAVLLRFQLEQVQRESIPTYPYLSKRE